MTIKTALVSYHNTLPFLHAIRASEMAGQFDLRIVPPSQCAQLYKEQKVDLALVPVGALSELEDYTILSDACIGTSGEVYTVAVFSNTPLEYCTHLYLDQDSRSSNDLAQIILHHYLHLYPQVAGKVTYPLHYEENKAYVLIGDKVFENEHLFQYKYDLGALWHQYTGLPFAFAVWIIRNTIDATTRQMAEAVINQYDIDKVPPHKISDKISLHEYLTRYISFELDEPKRKAIGLYLRLQSELYAVHVE